MKRSARFSNVLIIAGVLAAFVLGTQAHKINISLGGVTTSGTNQSLSKNLDDQSIQEVYDVLREKFDGKLDTTKLIDGMKKGLVDSSGDPYTSYMSPTEAKLFNSQIEGSFEGIGAELGKEGDRPIVITPIEGYPAQKAGIKPKDTIIEIDSQDTAGMAIDEAVLKIRGEKGTKVTLKLLRAGELVTVEITREEIKIPSVTFEVIENGTIGYLRLNQFGSDTNALADQAAREFKTKGVKAVILDLRNNPGGLLDSSTHIAGLWIENKTVVREKRDGKVIDELSSTGTPLLAGLPTVILANEGSASASEIVTGALQDYGLATFVGVKTYGKGSVQELTNLENGGVVKVTIARWYTPNDKNIDKEGIKPDVEVKPGSDPSVDSQRQKAIEILKGKTGN